MFLFCFKSNIRDFYSTFRGAYCCFKHLLILGSCSLTCATVVLVVEDLAHSLKLEAFRPSKLLWRCAAAKMGFGLVEARTLVAAAAMLRLQKFLLPVRRFACPANHPLHSALLSTAASASPARFAAEDYLVTTCGLTKEQAAKAAKHIAHRNCASNANAVLDFLASSPLGLSKADIALLVSRDARILNCSVAKTLRPRVDSVSSYGFTAAQIRTFLIQAPYIFSRLNVDEKLGFWLSFLRSPEEFLRFIKRNFFLVTSDLDKVVKVNIQQLRESGLSDDDIAKVCVNCPRLLTSNTDRVRAILMRAEEIGVPRTSHMFKEAVAAVACMGRDTVAAKLKFMGEMLQCSDAEVAQAVKISPGLLRCSTDRLHRNSEFLTKVVGLDSKYILGRPPILTYSLERRLAPRHYVMKVLLEKGLMRKAQSF
jgi:mTERF domain-containing protein, mitochondrial